MADHETLGIQVPCPPRCSPFRGEALAAESRAWIRSYGIADPVHDYADLAFFSMPLTVSRARMRWLCDYFQWLLPTDDLLDRPAFLGADPVGVRRLIDGLDRVVEGGSGPWHSPYVAAFADLWRRIVPDLSRAQAARLAGYCRDYGEGLIFMAEQRRGGRVPPFTEFLTMRRKESVGDVCLMLIEYSTGTDGTGRRGDLDEIRAVFGDYAIVTQDLLSYRKEQQDGDLLNCIDAYRLQRGCSREAAFAAVTAMERRLRDRFIELTGHSGPHPGVYADGCRLFIAGYLAWTFSAARYRETDRSA